MNPILLFHLSAALPALVLGTYVLATKKGTSRHKIVGRVYVVLMLMTVFSSFFITQLNNGRLSVIHILSMVTLVSITWAMVAIRKRKIRSHQRAMKGAYFGLLAAFVLTFLPERDMHLFALYILGLFG